MDKKTIKTEEGSALVLVMMVLLVLSVLGAALGVATIGSLNLSENNQDINSAYYIAQAGANMAYEEVKSIVDTKYNQVKNLNNDAAKLTYFTSINSEIKKVNKEIGENYFSSDNKSKATIELIGPTSIPGNDNVHEYTIKSIGEVNGKTRTVEKPIEILWRRTVGYGEVQWGDNVAITFQKMMNIKNYELNLGRWYYENYTTTVYGDIVYDSYLNDHSINSDKLGNWHGQTEIMGKPVAWESYNNFLRTFPESTPQYPINEVYKKQRDEYNRLKWWYDLFGGFKTRTISVTENTYIPEINSILISNIIVDSTHDTVDVVVDNFNAEFMSRLEIKGNTTVNLYVKNSLDLGAINNMNTRGNKSQLNILYYGSNDVVINGKTDIHGSLFLKEAALRVYGNTVITDGIISGGSEIEIYGDNSISGIIFAPNATFNVGTRSLLGNILNISTNIKGIVLAKNLNLHGRINVIYDEEFINDFYFYAYDAEVAVELDDLISAEPALEQ